eukprot:6482576-Amphidinium_carterae.1
MLSSLDFSGVLPGTVHHRMTKSTTCSLIGRRLAFIHWRERQTARKTLSTTIVVGEMALPSYFNRAQARSAYCKVQS